MLWFSSRYGGFFSSRQYVSDLSVHQSVAYGKKLYRCLVVLA